MKKSISRARDPRLPDQPEPPTHGCGSIFVNERVRLEAVVGELLELSIVEWHLRETIRFSILLKNIRLRHDIRRK